MTEWQRLERKTSRQIIDKLKTPGNESLFSENTSEVSCSTLPFYKHFLLYRITNYATLPSLSLDFLGDGHTFYHLDGSPDPLSMVNNRGDLRLNDVNILGYINFFLSYVTSADGDIYLIEDPDTLPFLDSLNFDQQIALKQKFTPMELEYNDIHDQYELYSDLYYDGTLVKAKITVGNNGTLSFSDHAMLR